MLWGRNNQAFNGLTTTRSYHTSIINTYHCQLSFLLCGFVQISSAVMNHTLAFSIKISSYPSVTIITTYLSGNGLMLHSGIKKCLHKSG